MAEREFGKYKPMTLDEATGARETMKEALHKTDNWPVYGELGALMMRAEEDYGTGLLPIDMEPLPSSSPKDNIDEPIAV
jgi:hypothetical protein